MLDPPALAESFGSTSSSLLVRAKAHEPAAWQRLVRLYGKLVYHWCRQAGLQSADAADIGQEVFRAAFAAIGRFQHEAADHTFRGWLRTITRNKIRDALRKQGRQLQASGGSDAQVRLREFAESSDDDSRILDSLDKPMLLQQALLVLQADFEPRTWQIFWRVTIDGRCATEVAEEFAVSLNSVYKAKSRVLHRLRTELAGLLD
jgi:RNA polymerase sigma-70 factor (ECF subfamily)